MKREISAAALLLLLIAVSLINLAHTQRLTGQVLNRLDGSKAAMEQENTELALEYWEDAFGIWEDSYSYTHIFIRHQEIDSAAEDFYSLKELILQEEREASAAAYEMLRYRLECIALMEKPTLGSVF